MPKTRAFIVSIERDYATVLVPEWSRDIYIYIPLNDFPQRPIKGRWIEGKGILFSVPLSFSRMN